MLYRVQKDGIQIIYQGQRQKGSSILAGLAEIKHCLMV